MRHGLRVPYPDSLGPLPYNIRGHGSPTRGPWVPSHSKSRVVGPLPRAFGSPCIPSQGLQVPYRGSLGALPCQITDYGVLTRVLRFPCIHVNNIKCWGLEYPLKAWTNNLCTHREGAREEESRVEGEVGRSKGRGEGGREHTSCGQQKQKHVETDFELRKAKGYPS